MTIIISVNSTKYRPQGGQRRIGGHTMYNFTRKATDAEMDIFNRVETVFIEMDEDEAEHFTETISDRVFKTFDRATDKAIYNRVYRLAKKYGFTVAELETWYCID